MLLLYGFAAIELFRFVHIDWLRLNLQIDDKMVFRLRSIMLIRYFHPTNLLLHLFFADHIDHALIVTCYQR